MPLHCQRTVAELRRAIDTLPSRTRRAMLDGIACNTIITGSHMDRVGGVCPMLAAQRQGARADFVVFAGAWDRFTGVEGPAVTICRRATPGELSVLVTELEASLHDATLPSDLAPAIGDHQALARARRAREASDVGLDWLHGGNVEPEIVPAAREEIVASRREILPPRSALVPPRCPPVAAGRPVRRSPVLV